LCVDPGSLQLMHVEQASALQVAVGLYTVCVSA